MQLPFLLHFYSCSYYAFLRTTCPYAVSPRTSIGVQLFLQPLQYFRMIEKIKLLEYGATEYIFSIPSLSHHYSNCRILFPCSFLSSHPLPVHVRNPLPPQFSPKPSVPAIANICRLRHSAPARFLPQAQLSTVTIPLSFSSINRLEIYILSFSSQKTCQDLLCCHSFL